MNWTQWTFKHPWMFYGGLLFVFVFIHVLLVFFTQYERNMTVKEKGTYGSSAQTRFVRNVVIDTDGRVYSVFNEPFLLHFRAAEIFMGLEKGRTYNIKGYGLRVPFLGWFPNITQVNTN